MADIIEQAKAAQHGVIQGPWELRDGFIYPLAIRFGLGSIRPQDARFIAWARTGVPELLAALKAAYRTIERNQAAIALRNRELKAARAENERLRKTWTPPEDDYQAPKSWDGKEPWPGDAVREAWK